MQKVAAKSGLAQRRDLKFPKPPSCLEVLLTFDSLGLRNPRWEGWRTVSNYFKTITEK